MPPKEFCPELPAAGLGAACRSAGTGTIVSYTVIRVAPRGDPAAAPYAVAVVRLDEGVSLLGRLVDIPLEAVKTGLPVRFRPLVDDQQTAIGFGPGVTADFAAL